MNTFCVKRKKDTENIDQKWLEQKITDQLLSQNVLLVELKSQDL